MPIAIPTPRGRETEQQFPGDAPKGAPLKLGDSLALSLQLETVLGKVERY
jgi:hypothetical protein